jgi:glycosyltransferase involved in cell wall biosynthesis
VLLETPYKSSDLGIFASSCENMPIILLETMAAGLPIAVSSSGPMPEIIGDSGLYFNPEKPTEIEYTLERLILDPELRYKLSLKSYKQAAQYDWNKCAIATFEFLANAHNNWLLNKKKCVV